MSGTVAADACCSLAEGAASREAAMVPVAIHGASSSRYETAGVDPCLASLVAALNAGGVGTVASCCGHGRRPGVVALRDGRQLVVLRDVDELEALNEVTGELWPVDINGDDMRETNVMGSGVELIAAERLRQVEAEGWSPGHDDEHSAGELSAAASEYLTAAHCQVRWSERPSQDVSPVPYALGGPWPWESEWWKPSEDPVRNLVKAGALIAAEIDRLLRARGDSGEGGTGSTLGGVELQLRDCAEMLAQEGVAIGDEGLVDVARQVGKAANAAASYARAVGAAGGGATGGER